MKAVLDNDSSSVAFIIPDNMDENEEETINEIDLNQFDEAHYWSDGIILLFKFAGITAEAC